MATNRHLQVPQTHKLHHLTDLTEKFVKLQIIQETGGNDARSLTAWKTDPAQVNAPGVWSGFKQSTGLTAPVKRNEGTVDKNLKAAITWLARKGFGKSGQPPQNRQNAIFYGWQKTLEDYNGKTVKTTNGKAYSVNYVQRIIDRENNPTK